MMFSTVKMRDILELSSVDRCQRYVFLTKEALDKVFYQLDVEPRAGVPIYFAPVDELTLSRQRDPEQAQRIPARNQNCMRVAFFYIRAFQILGALSLNLFDTIPLRSLTTGAAARLASGPQGQQQRPGTPRQLGGGLVRPKQDEENRSPDYFKSYNTIKNLLPSVFIGSSPTPVSGLLRYEQIGYEKIIFFRNPAHIRYQTGFNETETIRIVKPVVESLDAQTNTGVITMQVEYNYRIFSQTGGEPIVKVIGSENDDKYITFEIAKDSSKNVYTGKLLVLGSEIPFIFQSFGPTGLGKKEKVSGLSISFQWATPSQGTFNEDIYLTMIYNIFRQQAGLEPHPYPSRTTMVTTQGPIGTGTTTVSFPQFQPSAFQGSFAGPTAGPTTASFQAVAPTSYPTASTTFPAAQTTVGTTAPTITAGPAPAGPTASFAGVAGPTQQRLTTSPVQAGEFVAFADLKRRLLDEKSFPKAYAVGRAMILLNPAHPSEQKTTTTYTSDICRPNRSPPDFDQRLKAMPVPQTQGRSNIYFQSLTSLYYDAFKVQNDNRLIIEQTPPGREALIQASYDLGLMFYVSGGPQEQVKFLYESKVIQFPPGVCPQNGALVVISKDDKYRNERAALLGKLRKITSTLLAFQEKYNSSAIAVLKKLFYDTKEKEFKIRPEIYKGGIPAMNKVADEARKLLLDYYRKSEAYYTLGVQAITEARQKTPGLIEYAAV